jgi:hypothetical protein
MPTTPASMKGAVAVSDDAVKKGHVKPLGYLTWFSVPDEQVSLRTLKVKWGLAGLEPEVLPKDTKEINAFKRAMRLQEGRRKVENGVTTIVETTVAVVDETARDCVYQISRLVRNLDERVIDYPKAAKVTFNKMAEHAEDQLTFRTLGGVPRADMIPVFEEIEAEYTNSSSKVTGAKVRTLVRNYLRTTPFERATTDSKGNRVVKRLIGLGGENLRGKAGGIYFVPAKYRDQLDSLSELLDELYKGRAYLHFVPLADGASEREIVRRHHIANAKQEYREAIAEARVILNNDSGRAPRGDLVANQFARMERLRRQASDYKAILQDESDDIADMERILSKQLDKLLG